ncbi:MAG TPA: glutathione S-transferase N-terminal domain-containing protein [Candidatus Binatia bacterium]|nr:glutathione S-transferase N-terminal domain-containing protein [Candidatus Binatia bacterium]
MNRALDVTTSFIASLAGLGLGAFVGSLGPRPAKPLEVYEFEGCPFCRKVREALTVLDLEALVYPCPKRGPRFRAEVKRRGGKEQFPYLIDPNTATEMYESDDIVRYLFEKYGSGPAPLALRLGPLTDASAMAASAARLGAGVFYRQSNPPEKPLELWSFEASPFCRIAREALCELEIPYWLHNVAKGSPRREAFVVRSGRMMVPYLVDPNRDVAMFESADIVAYLNGTYAKRGG